MLYFGYGSNMPRVRIEARVGRFERLGPAFLPGWRLAFHKTSTDGSGKCDVVFTGNPEDRVWGALDRLRQGQMDALDAYEPGYLRKSVNVSFEGGLESAMLYVARENRIDPNLRPYGWYKELVVAGARELGLPRDYVSGIEAVRSMPDPKPERAERNRAILDRLRRGE